MNLTLMSEGGIALYALPDEVDGKHQLFYRDNRGKKRKAVEVEAKDGLWVMRAHRRAVLYEADTGKEISQVELRQAQQLYELQTKDEKKHRLLVEDLDSGSKRFTKVGFFDDVNITIGSAPENLLCYKSAFVPARYATLQLRDETFFLEGAAANTIYINGRAVPTASSHTLHVGDVLFIQGLKIAVGKRFIAYNNPQGSVVLSDHPAKIEFAPQEYTKPEERLEDDDETDCFYRSPRIKRDVEVKTIDVEAPPAQHKKDESPAILKIGPSLGMAMASGLMGMYMLSNILGGQGNALRAVPMLGMMIVMILGAVLWPTLSRRYEKRKTEREESKRRATYASYLDKIRKSLITETALQKEILEENRVSLQECLSRVYTQDRKLFERTPLQSDFLELRIGRGDTPLAAEVKFPQDKLRLDEDLLVDLVNELAGEPRVVADVPLSLELASDYVCGVVAKREDYYPFMRGLIAQICTLHAPEEVKIVFFGNADDEQEWQFVRALPHIYDAAYTTRFLATDEQDALEVSLRLERELQLRSAANNTESLGDYGDYYVVFVANKDLASKNAAIASLNAQRNNRGFSIVTFAENIRELPKECRRIIELNGEEGSLYDPRDASDNAVSFTLDIALSLTEADAFMRALASIKLESVDSQSALPKKLGFLEMFEAGKVEHLNIPNRWKENNPCLSLQTPLGVDQYGTLSMLDVHENIHGPHGLVAGMTGSGKSEFIITYILSLAVNYRPDEVAFVLIDYKGGGLAGAFDNESVKLPHLAGTITNLDGAAITRSMASIKSELRRRQDVFNQARDAVGESTMDIYKYQALYREGKVGKPVPHLFIISDEFAELKSQQPEFMDELISAARIGRSLGIHLILATQKPSGVVNDQIWSNAKFKICLKVADAADSKEMLKRPDAAELVDAGRYYLQVGYNEYFQLGQSAYAGARYLPQEEFEPKKDNSVVLINNNGRGVFALKPAVAQSSEEKAPEARVVLEHIASIAAQMGLGAAPLWAEPIPKHITLADLEQRYPLPTLPFELNPIIGEYDDPANQRQCVLTLPITTGGNAVLYGTSNSGMEMMLNTLLCSLITHYTARELNLYLVDLGAETLGVFRQAPQVGAVLFSGDDEQIYRLFDMLGKMIEARKKVLSASGTSFDTYNKDATAPLASVVVVLNGIANFYELYPKLEDKISTLTREANRYGIYFVLTSATATSVRLRLRNNFKQSLVLSFNDVNDYGAILGSVRGIHIPNSYGRGLWSSNGIYEYQCASVYNEGESEIDAIKALVSTLQHQDAGQAPSVPYMPKKLTPYLLVPDTINTSRVPFGLFESTLEPAYLEFEETPFYRIMYNRNKDGMAFVKAFLTVMGEKHDYYETVLCDFSHSLPENFSFTGRVIEDEAEAAQLIMQTHESVLEKPRLFVISGIYGFISRLSTQDAKDVRAYLRSLKAGQGTSFLLFDSSTEVQYSSEEWFNVQIGRKEGLWIGEGLNGQTVFNLNYTAGVTIDQSIRGDRGYIVREGLFTAVKYMTLIDEGV